jgi:hypothetical protein
MRQAFIITGFFVAALAGAAHAQSTVGDALKNKPGSVGLQDPPADSGPVNSGSANGRAAGGKDGNRSAGTAPKPSNKARPVPGKDAVPLGSTADRAGRDKAAADDTSGHGAAPTDSRKSANRTGTTGNSNMTH